MQQSKIAVLNETILVSEADIEGGGWGAAEQNKYKKTKGIQGNKENTKKQKMGLLLYDASGGT